VRSGEESTVPAEVRIEILGEWAWNPVPACSPGAQLLGESALAQQLGITPVEAEQRWWEEPLAAEIASLESSSATREGLVALRDSLEALASTEGGLGGRLVCNEWSVVRGRMAVGEGGDVDADLGGVVLGLLADFDPSLDGDEVAEYIITRAPAYGSLTLSGDTYAVTPPTNGSQATGERICHFHVVKNLLSTTH
jgi:hypothetical protein